MNWTIELIVSDIVKIALAAPTPKNSATNIINSLACSIRFFNIIFLDWCIEETNKQSQSFLMSAPIVQSVYIPSYKSPIFYRDSAFLSYHIFHENKRKETILSAKSGLISMKNTPDFFEGVVWRFIKQFYFILRLFSLLPLVLLILILLRLLTRLE